MDQTTSAPFWGVENGELLDKERAINGGVRQFYLFILTLRAGGILKKFEGDGTNLNSSCKSEELHVHTIPHQFEAAGDPNRGWWPKSRPLLPGIGRTLKLGILPIPVGRATTRPSSSRLGCWPLCVLD
ncbi:hypothetical protein CRG98_008606 [Punica granatum]|uniref:Uncharacterized protein n=1 Tax=Punica granatum TaxID=22663 RepID=A0A2I0KRA0_PUNGR|nr:hypothetical protein CRG98_008606 [Punica granatum]